MKKAILIKIGKFLVVFFAIVGFIQFIIGLVEFFTGSNPICG